MNWLMGLERLMALTPSSLMRLPTMMDVRPQVVVELFIQIGVHDGKVRVKNED